MDKKCPACGGEITAKQAIEILNGTGYQRTAKVKLPDGRIDFMPANLVNPREVEVLEVLS
jgi:hypothetical protein